MKRILIYYNRVLRKLASFLKNIRIPLPLPGLGCGVVGLVLPKVSVKMGSYAAKLLKGLEYRGFDSTGAAFQREDQNVILLKDVGAPSKLIKTLGIDKQDGKLFCGQVRWASSGAVTKENAQPHEVKCKRHLYGAHNGNITNTNELKIWLTTEGHTIVSDDDGEMLVHSVEHNFDIEMNKAGNPDEPELRKACLRRAVVQTAKRIEGSYAAVITDPVTQTMWAIKSGSSLYFGHGDLDGMSFGLASSDLTSVLRFTKMVVNLREGEFIEFDSSYYQVYAQKELHFKSVGKADEDYQAGDPIPTRSALSRLRAEDVELQPKYKYFMEQEIYAEPESVGKLVKLFQGGSNSGHRMVELMESEDIREHLTEKMREILDNSDPDQAKANFDALIESAEFPSFFEKARTSYQAIFDVAVREDFEQKYLFSDYNNTLIDLIGEDFDVRRMILAKAFDALSEMDSVQDFEKKVREFLQMMKNTLQKNRIAYSIACGTSYHATKVGSLFFNEIAGVEIIPILPGDFRGEYSHSMKDHDFVIGVSQSGETKDLIDIFNDITERKLDVGKAVLVNNVNSTLGIEKSDLAIPIYCGPETAVPATKSFMNQIALFYFLAIRTAEMKLKEDIDGLTKEQISEKKAQLKYRTQTLQQIPSLIKETLENTSDVIDSIAAKIYMEPSLHILATKISGVAMEGALKIRETVLNHAEGREASEFKHGPNTILGKNTVYGFKHVRRFVRSLREIMDFIDSEGVKRGLAPDKIREVNAALMDHVFYRNRPFNLSPDAEKLFHDAIHNRDFYASLDRNYPLIYVTGPDAKDVNLTASQINTHKIRGADTFVIAEENEHLFRNASTIPREGRYYGWGYVMLPRTGDSLLTCFSATAVLQLLALRMSVRKMNRLDRLGMMDHGVHPDVPKNVSKSITVD